MDREGISVSKIILWEEAKGKLRALSNVAGHLRLVEPTTELYNSAGKRWKKIDETIEQFIKDFEYEGLQE